MDIRQVRPSDQEPIARFYAALSDENRRSRFLGVSSGISLSSARSFCTLDHLHDQGFVATVAGDDAPTVVGHVCLYQTGRGTLELGIAVADDYQGLGIGRRLFQAAVAWAQARHFTAITASCLADNTRVLALLSSAPFGAAIGTSAAGVVELTIPLEPTTERRLDTLPRGARPRRRDARRRALQPAARVWRLGASIRH